MAVVVVVVTVVVVIGRRGGGSSGCHGRSGSVGISMLVCGMHPPYRENPTIFFLGSLRTPIGDALACSLVFCGMKPSVVAEKLVTTNGAAIVHLLYNKQVQGSLG